MAHSAPSSTSCGGRRRALKRPAVENLVWVGGFEGLGLTRRELLWQVGLWLGPGRDDERTGGRDDHAQTELALDDPYADLAFPTWTPTDRMVAEYRMLHFSAETSTRSPCSRAPLPRTPSPRIDSPI